MILSALTSVLLVSSSLGNGFVVALEDGKHGGIQEALGSGMDGERYKTACPDYKHYSVIPQYVKFLVNDIGLTRGLVGP